MSHCAGDVTALMLNMGEPTFDEAVRALETQTTPPAQIIKIDSMRPFHTAFNHGVEQVDTEFLLQCDADMILDPDCIEALRACMAPDVGIAAAYLEDELLGYIQAVKLFRTDSVRRRPLPPTLTSDSDRAEQLQIDDERIIFVARERPRFGHPTHVLGHHRPPYDDPRYLFGRFHRLGRKARLRQSYGGFLSLLRTLKKTPHPMADHAIAALCIGVVAEQPEGFHAPFEGNREYETLMAFASQKAPPSEIHRAVRATVVWPGEVADLTAHEASQSR
jgi:hypothetical protein